MTAFEFYTAVVYAVVALLVLFNIPTLLGLAHESLLWIRINFRIPPTRAQRFLARLRRDRPPVVAISERDRLNVIVRMDLHRKARTH